MLASGDCDCVTPFTPACCPRRTGLAFAIAHREPNCSRRRAGPVCMLRDGYSCMISALFCSARPLSPARCVPRKEPGIRNSLSPLLTFRLSTTTTELQRSWIVLRTSSERGALPLSSETTKIALRRFPARWAGKWRAAALRVFRISEILLDGTYVTRGQRASEPPPD